jgi:hypothetical protein
VVDVLVADELIEAAEATLGDVAVFFDPHAEV